MTPLQVAVNLAESASPQDRARGVAMLARALSDPDPRDPLRLPWTVDVAVLRAAQYLHLNPTPELLEAARAVMPAITNAELNYSQDDAWVPSTRKES
jgi:hypothetical protein